MFIEHLRDVFIAHSSKGYIATTNNEIILKSINDNFKRSRNMLWKYGRVRKALNEKYNLRLELEKSGLFEEEN